MSPKQKAPASRYMKFEEVAADLGVSRTGIYDKARAGQLVVVNVGTAGHSPRVTRKSFEEYCARLEAEADKRFGATG